MCQLCIHEESGLTVLEESTIRELIKRDERSFTLRSRMTAALAKLYANRKVYKAIFVYLRWGMVVQRKYGLKTKRRRR